MSGARGRKTAPGAVDILEEATHLIRLAPVGTLAPFYAGSVPFVLALLFFWSDMSRNALARRHVVTGSLVVAVLYIWMKAWQAVFARRLRARLSGEAAPHPSPSTARLLLAQAALQPTALFVLPLAALVMLPYGWAYAFYQSLGVTGDSETAKRQALLWPGQNHSIIAILTLLGCFVFLNIAMTIAAIPFLLKTLLGIETAFSASPLALLNTTFFLIACGLTYLVTAPLARAAYVVRCFHGDSLSTGEDLKAELRALGPARRAAAIVVLTLALGAGAPVTAGSETTRHAPEAAPRVPPAEIDRAVRNVIARREFAWRLPEPPARAREGMVARFFSAVGEMTMDALRAAFKWIGHLLERLLRSWQGGRPGTERGEDLGWLTSVQGLLAILLAVVACAAAIFFWRSRRRSAPMAATLAAAVAAVPDVSVDESAAAETPAESWLERARELARRGDLRQAIRALYLGCLSHLAARELLTLARFKSNRDYQAELKRRARTGPELGSLFAENVALFERTWYGTHEATQETMRRSLANFERMRVHALE
ncbi:MAG TPA: DUF4129 domain-containing protein [Candidatus Polarisedimenticolia bacterium]|nr:DUF4129 domain-containing protein [Candidatus Polarisedimenticolia bacterium]